MVVLSISPGEPSESDYFPTVLHPPLSQVFLSRWGAGKEGTYVLTPLSSRDINGPGTEVREGLGIFSAPPFSLEGTVLLG